MQEHFQPVTDLESLNRLVQQSDEQPVILFKHDPYCSISMFAYSQMTGLAEPVALINVARDRDVSMRVEAETGVRHESPQVLVLHHGKPLWAASHYDVTRAAVEHVLQQANQE